MATRSSAVPLLDDFMVVALHGKRLELMYRYSGAAAGGGVEPAGKAAADAKARAAAVLQFCFPDVEDQTSLSLQSESFTFTLTQDDGARCFGFSRRLAGLGGGDAPICLCVLSRRPWFSLFMHMLDVVQLNYDSIDGFVPAFVAAATAAELPPPGGILKVCPSVPGREYGLFRLHAPYDDERPTGVALEPLLSALGVPNTVRLLGALMLEQRVIFIGSRWGHVSSCAHAALTLLYPLTWQHIFIPILPTAMLSYACAPMPYVLGVLSRHLPQLEKEPIEDALFVDLDAGRMAGGDASAPALPKPISQALERSLSAHVRHAKRSRLDNQAVADAVLNLCMVRASGPSPTARPPLHTITLSTTALAIQCPLLPPF
jgi:hypothetical protein